MRLFRIAHYRAARGYWQRRMDAPFAEVPPLRANSRLAALSQRKLAGRVGREAVRANAVRVFEGRFCFLQHEVALPDPVDWRVEGTAAAPLWRFQLHYHDYLLDLAAQAAPCGGQRWLAKAWALVLDWIGANRLDDRRVLGDAWHPYCISRRLPVWIHLWSTAPPPDEARARVLGSMIWQGRYLERHLEWDLRGNHLLENLRALALMGAFFEGPDARRWLRIAAARLPGQLAEQILPHGEHFERSPSYHADALEALLDVRDALAGIGPSLAGLCSDAAMRMALFLRAILHPDGDIPLLGDSCLGRRESIWGLLESAGGNGPTESSPDLAPPRMLPGAAPAGARIVGDYWLFRQAGDFLLFDAGPVGADALPAHAHADLLTLEASIGGRRLFVDSGVFSYDDEPVRRYCRSTAAHNVVQIDETDQCDLYSRFRMGYRGRPSALEAGQEHGFAWARASHNAYRRLGVPQVGRWLACRPGGPWLCLDWACGAGRHRLASWLHLHPAVRVWPLDDDTLQLELAARRLRLRWLQPGDLAIDEGWYCPQLGRKHHGPAVRWQATVSLPAVCGWCLTWDDAEGTASLRTGSSGETLVCWTEDGRSVEFSAHVGCPKRRGWRD